VLHLFYRVDQAAWRAKTDEKRALTLDHLEALLTMARQQPRPRLSRSRCLRGLTSASLILTPDLHNLNVLERTSRVARPDCWCPCFTYLSMTEKSDTRKRTRTTRWNSRRPRALFGQRRIGGEAHHVFASASSITRTTGFIRPARLGYFCFTDEQAA